MGPERDLLPGDSGEFELDVLFDAVPDRSPGFSIGIPGEVSSANPVVHERRSFNPPAYNPW
jgi:hypothetical protein